MRNFERLLDNLEPVMAYIESRYCEVWRQEYPLPGMRKEQKEIPNEILNKINKTKEFVLYVHIPFCENRNKCDYCGYFAANDINEFSSKAYVDCLLAELEILKESGKKKILSIFMGGGTPSLLEANDFDRLMNYIYSNFIIDPNAQVSIEATPYSVTSEKAKSYAKNKVNRLCLGVQSFNEQKLSKVNRPQKQADVYHAVKILRENGINNIHFDLIYNLVYKENVDEFIKDNLEHLLKLRPKNVSLFPLQHYIKYPESIYSSDNQDLEQIKKIMNDALKEDIVTCSLSFGNKDNYKYQTLKDFPLKSSLYYFLRRMLLKNVCAVGFGGNSHFWLDGKFIKKEANYENIDDYKKDALAKKINYKYFSLSKEHTIKKYFIHRLCDGIELNFTKKFFADSMEYFNDLLKKVEPYTYVHKNVLFLKKDFKEKLPAFTKNENINYFLFCFYYLYSKQDQELLLKNSKV